MLAMTIGVGVVVSGCTADEPGTPAGEVSGQVSEAEVTSEVAAVGLRGAPEVGAPMPGSAMRNVPNRDARGVEADDYEFLYRTNDDSMEFYRGPTRSVTSFGGDNTCITEVALPAETHGMQCALGDSVGGPSYVDGVLIGGAVLSQTAPDDDLPWSHPVEGFWVIDLTEEE